MENKKENPRGSRANQISRRKFFQVTSAASAGAALLPGTYPLVSSAVAPEAPSRHWFEKPLRVFDMAIESDYATLLNQWTARSLLELVRRVEANVLDLMIVSEWGHAFFESSYLSKHPQLGARDLLREVLAEARPAGIRVVGMWGPSPNPSLYKLHPDWAHINREGEISGWGYMHLDPCIHLCILNSPYKEVVFKILEELFQNYPIDGVSFDYLFAGSDKVYPNRACFCEYCRARYLEDTGIDLNQRSNWQEAEFRALWDWEIKKFEEFLIETRRIANARDRIIVVNRLWEPGNYEGMDVLFQEQHTGDMITLQDKGFEVRRTVAIGRAHGKPVVHCYPYAHGYCVGLPKAPEHMRQETREILISGASPWIVGWENEIVQETRGWDDLGVVFKEAKQLEGYLSDVEPLNHLALLLSHQSSDVPGMEPYEHFDHAKGFYDALTRSHIPVDLIVDQDLTLERLSRYSGLILANARCLSREQGMAIRAFVERGGGLVATYETSLSDDEGRPRDGFLLGDVFGCQYAGYIRRPWVWIEGTAAHPLLEGFVRGSRIPHGEMKSLEGDLNPQYRSMSEPERRLRGITPNASRHLKVKPGKGTQVLATLVDTLKELGDSWFRHVSPPVSRQDMGYPALVAQDYSAGRVVYFPGQVDRLYYRIGHPEYGRFLLNAARWIAGPAPVEVTAPATVEATFYEQKTKNRLVIHLLNHSYDQLYPRPTHGSRTLYSPGVIRAVGKAVPVDNITVRMPMTSGRRVTSVYSVLEQQKLPFEEKGREVRFVVPRLEEYRVIAIQQSE